MIIGVIPARWDSKRFPGKPLAMILGKSLVQRTYENAKQAQSLDHLVVATDDKRIFDHVEAFGGRAIMTSSACQSGTERMQEVMRQGHFPQADIWVNIQGDEPCVDPKIIDTLVEKLKNTKGAVFTTPVAKITDLSGIFDPATVKCVFSIEGKALYFSRAPIPFPFNSQKIHDYYRHVGVYCLRRSLLQALAEMEFSRLEEIESLEQLKILENGYPIHVCTVQDQSIGVNHPEDIQKVEKLLCQENTSSSPAELSPR